MLKVPVKAFVLSHAQLKLAKTMIRSAELRNRKTEKIHDLLEAKIQAALLRSRRQSWPTIHLDLNECRLMRNYNTDYCALLSNSDDNGTIANMEVIRTYHTANQLQILFSSSNFKFNE